MRFLILHVLGVISNPFENFPASHFWCSNPWIDLLNESQILTVCKPFCQPANFRSTLSEFSEDSCTVQPGIPKCECQVNHIKLHVSSAVGLLADTRTSFRKVPVTGACKCPQQISGSTNQVSFFEGFKSYQQLFPDRVPGSVSEAEIDLKETTGIFRKP